MVGKIQEFTTGIFLMKALWLMASQCWEPVGRREEIARQKAKVQDEAKFVILL